MKLVIVTGMSGAGKTTALRMLEDSGYFCVDNLPVPLMDKFVALFDSANHGEVENAAIGIDVRSRSFLENMESALEHLERAGIAYQILYLDASDAALIKRFKETRRLHPMNAAGRVDEGIRMERERVAFLKAKANFIIDTSNMLTRELKQEIQKIMETPARFSNLVVTVLSFGFKYGIPSDADLVFDVRFLPNPYYIDELRQQTGMDAPVYDYVMDSELAQSFTTQLVDMIRFLLPNYAREGKTNLVIGIGCTGGRHRSVSIARTLYDRLCTEPNYMLRLEHRDIKR